MQGLLDEVAKIRHKHEQIDKSTGRLFNIFDIVRISWKEVPVCMLMHEILNPGGTHFQNGKYLKLFCEYALGIAATEKECNNAKVYREYLTKNGRRIDLFIEIADKKIPIEVKIFASDQYSQCADYLKYSCNSKLYYLTRHEQDPDEDSSKGRDGDIVNITFDNQILLWISKCLEDRETIQLAPVREVLLQFDFIIRNFTGRLEGGKEMEIQQMLLNSEKNMRSAIDVERALKQAKIQMLKEFFEEFAECLDKAIGSNLAKVKNTPYAYDANNYSSVNTYYDRQTPTWPGISYRLMKIDRDNIDIWLRVEAGYNLYLGLCVVADDKWVKMPLSYAEIKKSLPTLEIDESEIDKNNWWICREDLLGNERKESPNFKEFNDAYFEICDKERRKKFIEQAVTRIEKFAKKV